MSPMSDLSCLNVPSHMSPMPKMSQWSCLPGLHGLTCLVSPVFNVSSPCLNGLISHVWSTLSPIFPQRLWSMNTLEQSDACRYLTFPTILFNVVHKMNGQQKGYNLIYFRIDNLFEQHPVYHKHTHISTWEPDSVDASPDVSQLFTTLFSYLRCSI